MLVFPKNLYEVLAVLLKIDCALFSYLCNILILSLSLSLFGSILNCLSVLILYSVRLMLRLDARLRKISLKENQSVRMTSAVRMTSTRQTHKCFVGAHLLVLDLLRSLRAAVWGHCCACELLN